MGQEMPRFAKDFRHCWGSGAALAMGKEGEGRRKLPRFAEDLRRCTLVSARVGIETRARPAG
ncbi:MAG: hypothetical protein C4345_02800, partial [Chloroflexota bacterium]